MTAPFTRDAAAGAAVLGFFATSWAGWGMDEPPAGWQLPLTAAMVAAVLLAVAGGVVALRHWRDGTVFDRRTSIRFGIVVGIEFAVAGIGAGLASAFHRPDLVPAVIALVVGLHFLPLAPLLRTRLYAVVGVLVSIVAIAAVPVANSGAVPVSALVGLGTALVLVAGAAWSLAAALAR